MQGKDTNNGQQPIQFVLLTQQILGDERLTTTAKLVLARASGFAVFFESAENTAKFLGVSVRTVKSARSSLVKLGYLVETVDTGHGKKYRVNLLPVENSDKPKDGDVQDSHTRSAKLAQEGCKTCTPEVKNLHTYNKSKINIKENYISYTESEPSLQAEPVENSELVVVEKVHVDKRRPDVNEVLEAFTKATGLELRSRVDLQRYSATRLIKAHGLENVLKVIKLLEKATADPYAPRIANIVQLERRWGDLALWWRKDLAKQQNCGNITL